jgi:hypothetical protein
MLRNADHRNATQNCFMLCLAGFAARKPSKKKHASISESHAIVICAGA